MWWPGGDSEVTLQQFEMAKGGVGTDMRVICTTDDGGSTREILAHTVIVLPMIPFFQAKGSYEEAEGSRRELVSDLREVSASNFEKILRWVYTGTGGFPTAENFYEYMHAVNLLQVDSLWTMCLCALIKNPLHKDALRLCDEFSERMPKNHPKYIKDFREWWGRETADGQPHKERLEKIMFSKSFRAGIQNINGFISWMGMRDGGDGSDPDRGDNEGSDGEESDENESSYDEYRDRDIVDSDA